MRPSHPSRFSSEIPVVKFPVVRFRWHRHRLAVPNSSCLPLRGDPKSRIDNAKQRYLAGTVYRPVRNGIHLLFLCRVGRRYLTFLLEENSKEVASTQTAKITMLWTNRYRDGHLHCPRRPNRNRDLGGLDWTGKTWRGNRIADAH
jgi:hypothetical protein